MRNNLSTAPTPYDDVNAVLRDFTARIQAILAEQFVGLYLYGSLALGDFNPHGSDIDFIVVTRDEITEPVFNALTVAHAAFDASGSPWAGRIEAAYIPLAALHHTAPTRAEYPQVEKGTPLFKAPLEIGWAFQLHSLHEHGVVVVGPDPRAITAPVDRESMRRAAAVIAGGWQAQAEHDPSWLDWLRITDSQAFVVLTLCRMLYSLSTGDVASKPAAARWAQAALGPEWADLIARALAGQHAKGPADEDDVAKTLALIRYTVKASQQNH